MCWLMYFITERNNTPIKADAHQDRFTDSQQGLLDLVSKGKGFFRGSTLVLGNNFGIELWTQCMVCWLWRAIDWLLCETRWTSGLMCCLFHRWTAIAFYCSCCFPVLTFSWGGNYVLFYACNYLNIMVANHFEGSLRLESRVGIFSLKM